MATSFYKAQAAKHTCEQHAKEQLDMFCRTCGKRVCEKCVKTNHKDHDWTTVNKIGDEVRRNTLPRIEQIRQRISEMKKASSEIKQSSEKQNVNKDIQNVRRIEKAMKELIGKQANKLVEKLENGASKEDISHEITAMEKMVGFFEEGIRFAHDNVVMEMEEEFRDMMIQSKSIVTRSEGRLRYIEGKIVPETLEFMLGEVREDAESSTGEQASVSVTEISSFTHGTEYINTINLISELEAWVSSYKSSINVLLSKGGKQINERNIGKDFADFTVIDNDHMCTLFGDKMIRRVSSSDVISDIRSTAPLRPVGICAARNGGLLVCLCSGKVSEINKDSYGEVHHLDMSGKLLRKYPDQDAGHTKLFTNPSRIAQNINLDLCVVDVIATDHTSRLVVVAVDGRKRFEYKGLASLKERFPCQDVVCDSKGRILLSDYLNNAVHLLTADGGFIQLLLTEQSMLRDPISLAVRSDKLWVGCSKGVIKVYQYNI